MVNNHWISVTNVDGNLGNRYTNDSVMVYDSFVSKKFSLNTIKQICCIIRPVSNIRVDTMNIMRQHNISDCGLFSIACATELAYGFNPGKCVWNTTEMRRHLLGYFKQKKLQRFPLTKERCIPFGSAVAFSSVEIFCSCCMPYDKNIDMIECVSCN